jgi:hypothetical protein
VLIAQEPIDLLDGVFGIEVARHRQRSSNRVNRKRGRLKRANGGVRQTQDTLGMQIWLEQPFNKLIHPFGTDAARRHARTLISFDLVFKPLLK